MALNNFLPLLKSFIANVLKRKACLKTKFKCMYVTTVGDMKKLNINFHNHNTLRTVLHFMITLRYNNARYNTTTQAAIKIIAS